MEDAATHHATTSQEIEERPPGYLGPDLDPTGLVLEPVEIARECAR